MKAADVMTPDPVCISPDASITDAIRLMLERKFSGLPVVDARGALVGIVTEGDLVRRAETGTQRKRWGWIEFLMGPGRLAAEYLQTASRKVGDVMTADVRTVTENSRLDEIVHLMERHQINRVPVVREGKLVGIVTRANLLHALASVITEAKPGLTSDASIRERVYAELKAQQWAPVGLINVVVRNGVVHLSGTLLDERQRGRSARPRKTSPESKPSKIILSGSTQCPGALSTHFEEEAEHEPPAAWHRLRLIKQFASQRAYQTIVSQYNSPTDEGDEFARIDQETNKQSYGGAKTRSQWRVIFNPAALVIAFVWQFKFPALRARLAFCLLHEIRMRRSIRTLLCFP